jgi:hypothetical protein
MKSNSIRESEFSTIIQTSNLTTYKPPKFPLNRTYRTRKDTKIKCYKLVAAPTLTYGSGNWDLSRSERREAETAEMFFVRRVPVYTPTKHILNKTKRSALQIYCSEERIKYYTIKTNGIVTS